MRSKLLTLFMAFAVMVALASLLSVAALANPQNANKAATPAKPKAHKRKKVAASASAGIPTGLQNCLNRLATLAAKEPFPSFEGQPEEIINNGMLWNDPKAKCAVTDQAQREKLFDLATAWRLKEADKVRSGLQEMGATATPAAEMAPARKPHRKPAKKSAGAANKNG